MTDSSQFDLVVIGSGPAGQKAAIQAAKAGKSVALIERDRELGGSCVHRGTIPSKTLRENALRVKNMRLNAELAHFELAEDVELVTLIDRLEEVLSAHDVYMRNQVERNEVSLIHGKAKFLSDQTISVINVRGQEQLIRFEKAVIASGSIPRHPENIAIDHEHLFDSDSILSMLYLPRSLTVLGGGVIASEYASIFQALGVSVTMIDKYPKPLGFLDDDLCATFVSAFEAMGGRWVGNTQVVKASWNGLSGVVTECANGETYSSDKLLCAAGRVANVEGLEIQAAGLELNQRGLLAVDDHLQTASEHIYAAGDIIGPPSLASASMEQGRRAVCNAFNLPVGSMSQMIPTGIYSIPELSSVGLSEAQARSQYGEIRIGVAQFDEIARGQISGCQQGMLKIISDAEGEKVLGVSIVGEGATELIHIGQMALLANSNVDIFVESIFNFPTLAEAYRVAALDIICHREKASKNY